MGYDDDDDRGRRWIANLGIVLLVALLAAGGFWVFSSGDSTAERDLSATVTAEPRRTDAPAGPSATSATSATDATDPADSTDAADTTERTDDGTTTSRPTATSEAEAAGDDDLARDEDPTDETATSEPEVASGGPTLPGSTAGTSDASSTTQLGDVDPAVGYPTNPDGTPLPVIAIFDTDTITITGYVPSEAARQRLSALAIANSKTEADVVDNMIVNPNVPTSVGVRVIEMNSVRFPERSARVEPPHAAELDRVVAIMNALPNVTVLVIGHADQRGSDAENFAISDERARAVVNYLRFMGISPTRLSSRAAGATDLLTLDNDAAAFALNRRTEFVFYGLLAE